MTSCFDLGVPRTPQGPHIRQTLRSSEVRGQGLNTRLKKEGAVIAGRSRETPQSRERKLLNKKTTTANRVLLILRKCPPEAESEEQSRVDECHCQWRICLQPSELINDMSYTET